MPRLLCQHCGKHKIMYRIYIDKDVLPKRRSKFANQGTKKEICHQCAVRFLLKKLVFNLRKIYRQNLGTSKDGDFAEDAPETGDFFHD